MSANYTAKRLATLESETHGELALGSKAIKGGWTVSSLPSGEAIATLGLDYNVNGETYVWNAETSLLSLKENLPSGLFSEVSSCHCEAIDTSLIGEHNTIMTAMKEFPNVAETGTWTLYPLEYRMNISGYSLPTKIHVLWTVRGIKAPQQ